MELKDIAKELIPDPVFDALNNKICPIVMIGDKVVADELVEESSMTLPYIYSLMNGFNYMETKPKNVGSHYGYVTNNTVANYVTANIIDIITGALVNYSDTLTKAFYPSLDMATYQACFGRRFSKIPDIREIISDSMFYPAYSAVQYAYMEHKITLNPDVVFSIMSYLTTDYMNTASVIFETFIENTMNAATSSGNLLMLYLILEGYDEENIEKILQCQHDDCDNKFITDAQFMYEYCICYMRQLAQEPLHNVAVGILEVIKNASTMTAQFIGSFVKPFDEKKTQEVIDEPEQENNFFHIFAGR